MLACSDRYSVVAIRQGKGDSSFNFVPVSSSKCDAIGRLSRYQYCGKGTVYRTCTYRYANWETVPAVPVRYVEHLTFCNVYYLVRPFRHVLIKVELSKYQCSGSAFYLPGRASTDPRKARFAACAIILAL